VQNVIGIDHLVKLGEDRKMMIKWVLNR